MFLSGLAGVCWEEVNYDTLKTTAHACEASQESGGSRTLPFREGTSPR